MGACGSTSAHAGALARVVIDGKGAEQPVLIWSKMDMCQRFNVEKKTSCKPRHIPGFGFACRKGLKPGTQTPNQDSWGFYRKPSVISAYGVFDGHGEHGHTVSDFVKETLTHKVVSVVHNHAQGVEPRIKACYQQVQSKLASKPGLGTHMSGTTATVVVHDHSPSA
mmetsp:Transcript_11304/g.32294  ORF Transcript_11304/g.32294 Transcript_11304/m.32294 type:complete len:166 (+) Transcript_11304:66-563(+)